MYSRNKFFLLIIFVVVLVQVVAVVVYKASKNQTDTLTVHFKTENLQSNQIRLTGMIWTSGLMDSELELLDLDSEYQLTKSFVTDNWEKETAGMYLVNNSSGDFEQYLGKCVAIIGRIKPGWEFLVDNDYKINGKWTYNRSALVVNHIEQKDLDFCIGEYDLTIRDKNTEGLEYETVKGTLSFAKRPAPDISYDFKLILDEPFVDELSATGNPVLTKSLDISSGSNEIIKQFIINMGNSVEVGGYMEWGYSESRFLRVDKLKTI